MTKAMRFIVGCLLRTKWSPEQISAFLREHGLAAPCPVTIHEHVWRYKLLEGDLHERLRHGGRPRRKAGAKQCGTYTDRSYNTTSIHARDKRGCFHRFGAPSIACFHVDAICDTRRLFGQSIYFLELSSVHPKLELCLWRVRNSA